MKKFGVSTFVLISVQMFSGTKFLHALTVLSYAYLRIAMATAGRMDW